MSQLNSVQITVECACGKRLKAPASAAGKRAKCPKCGNILRVEAPPPPDDAELGLDTLYDLAEKEAQVAASQEGSAQMRCPSCGGGVEAGAVLCINCGYDFRTRSKIKAKSNAPAPPPMPGAPPKSSGGGWFQSVARKDKDEQQSGGRDGNFLTGLLLGTAGAAVGAGVCAAVWFNLPEMPFTGWLVLLIGFLAGFGVNKGYKAGTHVAGAVAAAITFIFVIGANFAVAAMILAPVVEEAAEELKFTRDHRVLDMVEDEQYKKANVERGFESDEQSKKFRADARKIVMDMPQAEYLKLVAKADTEEIKGDLIPHITEEILVKERGITNASWRDDSYKFAEEEATKRVEAMSPAERKKKLAAYSEQSLAELEAEMKELRAEAAREAAAEEVAASNAPADGDDDEGGGSIMGFLLIGAVAFFIWWFIPGFVAMALAWKVAADA